MAKKHRDFLRFNCYLRRAEHDANILKANQDKVMEWYCRDLYVESVRLAMRQWKEELLRSEVTFSKCGLCHFSNNLSCS